MCGYVALSLNVCEYMGQSGVMCTCMYLSKEARRR